MYIYTSSLRLTGDSVGTAQHGQGGVDIGLEYFHRYLISEII